MLSDGTRSFAYDVMNRLSRVTNEEGGIQKNRYDGEGLRAEMEENGRLATFLFDGDKVVAETESDGNVIRYIRGYELVSSDSEKARTYYHYTSDELGSITHVTDGNVCNYYEYDAFGEFTVREETAANRFAHAGEQYEPVAGLYYLRARFYNPVIGRFIQEDTYYGDGLNLYSYCRNNPVGYVDPSGHGRLPCDQKEAAINTLEPEEIEAIRRYTREHYININRSLRGLEEATLENQIAIANIKSALNKVGLPEDMILYRDTDRVELGKLQGLSAEELVGKTFEQPSFLSTSTKNSVASNTFQGNMHMTIEAPKGAKGIYVASISAVAPESEILFQADTKMYIKSAKEVNGVLYIVVKMKK